MNSLLLLLAFFTFAANAEKISPASKPSTAKPTAVKVETSAEEVDVQKIKEKYWARGNEAEMGVVQNRLYPKRRRIELGIGAGNLSGDPFLSTYTFGANLGFHFSEFFALHLVGWSTSVSASSALKTLQSQLNTTANTNEPKSYYGTEARASVLYGKLSLVGSAILYFDAYFSGGAGLIKTESGTSLLVSAGIGQQIHLSRVISINIDYKVLWYKETILGKVSTGTGANLGKVLGSNTNLSNTISLGLSVFMNPFGG